MIARIEWIGISQVPIADVAGGHEIFRPVAGIAVGCRPRRAVPQIVRRAVEDLDASRLVWVADNPRRSAGIGDAIQRLAKVGIEHAGIRLPRAGRAGRVSVRVPRC